MYKIRTYNRISDKGLNLLAPERFQVADDMESPHAFMLRSQKLHGEPLPEGLLAMARAGAGVNNIPVDDCTARGIVVFNTPGANANAVKELVAAGLLLGSRDVFGGMAFVQSLQHEQDPVAMSKLLEAEKKRFAGSEIQGKTLGVVGLGAIGAMVANMALELGMNVAGFDRSEPRCHHYSGQRCQQTETPKGRGLIPGWRCHSSARARSVNPA